AGGRGGRLRGRDGDARAAFEQAEGLIEAGDEIPLADRVALWTGLLSSGGGDAELARRILGAMPAALTEPTTWAELPILAAYLEHHPDAVDGVPPQALEVYRRAVAHRRPSAHGTGATASKTPDSPAPETVAPLATAP
ncbi:MAG: hypothetical protein AAGF23_09300, partial [Acidobacteriota bacterium]